MGAEWKWAALAAALIAALAVFCALLVLRRTRQQLSEMTEALADIREGNGNRRILAETHELTAPIAYGINDIVVSYEERLASLLRMEETNRQLMTSLSHDVRTPLTTLIGYLDAVHRGTDDTRQREEDIEIARRKAHELKEYIDVLFDWFKLNSDEFSMELKRVEATELTRSILIDWIPVLEDAGISYVVEIPEKPFFVRIDEDAYVRVLNNLIQNVVAHSHAQQMTLTLCAQGDMLCLRLADDGVGIEPEDLGHIFERLYKCDKGRSARGSGLGLSIVRQLVEQMGGKISAGNGAGRGACFVMHVPLEK